MQRKLVEAEKYLKQALAEAKEGFGEDDPHVAGACNNLAELYRLKKDFPEAEALYTEVGGAAACHTVTHYTCIHDANAKTPLFTSSTNSGVQRQSGQGQCHRRAYQNLAPNLVGLLICHILLAHGVHIFVQLCLSGKLHQANLQLDFRYCSI